MNYIAFCSPAANAFLGDQYTISEACLIISIGWRDLERQVYVIEIQMVETWIEGSFGPIAEPLNLREMVV